MESSSSSDLLTFFRRSLAGGGIPATGRAQIWTELAAMDGGGSAGAPAPFLLKTYEMVEDSSTDEIVSWSEGRSSFVVWNPPEFASVLLPTYFKHNNFSSFIRQLNTYGFRKIDAEKWEFANDDFVQGKKHLLKNIHRKKPVYSHSQPPAGDNSERSAMEEEIDSLTSETSRLESTLSRVKDRKSQAKFQINDLDLRLRNMEIRQQKMLSFVSRAIKNPIFVDHLLRLSNSMPIDLSEIHKKRRLQGAEQAQFQIPSSKLRLGLPSAISDSSVPSPRTQSSGEGFNNPECSSIDSRNEDEGDRHISCLLNLTLSSSPVQQTKKSSARVNAEGGVLSQPGKVNDKFWEQFLTERPGSSDTEANSALKVGSPEDHDKDTMFRRSRKDIDRLSL